MITPEQMNMDWNTGNQFFCLACNWFSEDGTCDMCAYGHPFTLDNNGKKPNEVKACDAFRRVEIKEIGKCL